MYCIAFHCFSLMSPLVQHLLLLVVCLVPPRVVHGATCKDCFTHSRADYYPNSDEHGTEVGACGYKSFGATLNGGYVTAVSKLYREGVGCGACYQVRCKNTKYCSEKGVSVVVTDSGSSGNTDFILSRKAFAKMAQTTDSAAALLALGVVDIEYRRVACSYPRKNITFKIDESSNHPYYLAFAIWYQQGQKDITAVQLCETRSLSCKLLERSHGAVWAVATPPRGELSVRMLFSDGTDGEERWLVPVNNISQNWKGGDIYDSGIQVE